MNLLERHKNDKVAIGTCIALVGAIIAKLVQAIILYAMTDYYPFSSEMMIIVGIGMLPSAMLLTYVVLFYKTEKTQLLLPCTFLFQLVVSGLTFWMDYTTSDKLDLSIIWGDISWVVYYLFLFIVTYKGFKNTLVLRIVIGGMSLYALVGSVVTWSNLILEYPEETAIIVAQAIATVGYFLYYLATFLITPKAVEENTY